MRTVFVVSLGCVLGVILGGGWILTASSQEWWTRLSAVFHDKAPPAMNPWGRSASPQPILSANEPTAPEPSVPRYGDNFVEDSGYGLRYIHTPKIVDRSSLNQLRAAIRTRGERGIADLQRRIAQLDATPSGSMATALERCRLQTWLATLFLSEGNFAEAERWIGRATESASVLPREVQTNLLALRGVAALRRGEIENCIDCRGPSSCIFPLDPAAVHALPSGSTEALQCFLAYLEQRPDDLGIRWLLNIAAMTLGEYPDAVPTPFRLPLPDSNGSSGLGRFTNVAGEAGLLVRGPNMAGTGLFDDFDGDGWPDLLTTSIDADLGASLFLNQGDGTFEDHATTSHLADQPLALNASQADFDNDGDLDVVLLRGGWEDAAPLTLLRNNGAGVFEDVTVHAGLGEPIATQSAAWGDFNNDGFVDLFVAGEYLDTSVDGLFAPEVNGQGPDLRNRCRLYQNRGDGTFVDVAAKAGVLNQRYAKGAAWGDFDDDGWIDLYVSNFGAPNRLYHNQGDGTFVDVAPKLGVDAPRNSFACWFWDYDNDGRLDLFAVGFSATMNTLAADAFGEPVGPFERSRLYRNLGPEGFREVTAEVGLDHPLLAMGASLGDIDNDGYLDIYLGTGRPSYSYLIPSRLFRNVEGRRFEDVTSATGTGHLQKGHGIAFADYDLDGDLDIFAQFGGAVPGDRSHNALFQNPGTHHHWLRLKLVGIESNRSALGARIRVDLTNPDGSRRSIHRQIGGGSSFGGNSLVETIGLRDASSVQRVQVTWPASGKVQTFSNVPANQTLEIRENRPPIPVAPPPTPRDDAATE